MRKRSLVRAALFQAHDALLVDIPDTMDLAIIPGILRSDNGKA